MNLFQSIILIALSGNTALGLFVLFSNPKRSVNIAFFTTTSVMMFWLISMFLASLPHSQESLLFWVRQTSGFASIIPLGFFILHFTIVNSEITIARMLHQLRYWLVGCLAMVAICHSPIFIVSSKVATETQTVPVSEYGIAFVFYLIFFISVSVAMIASFWKGTRELSGVQKAESQFLQLGCLLSFSSGIMLYGASVLFNIQEASRFVPLAVLILDGFVAYGIATRRIMAASVVLQRVVSFFLMSCYLIVVYIVAEKISGILFLWIVSDTTYLSHLLAALVVAFSVAPAHGRIQAFSNRLFFSSVLNVDDVLARAGHIFREVSTEAKLMESFSDLITKTFGTIRVVLLRPSGGNGYTQCYPEPNSNGAISLEFGSLIVQLLERDHDPPRTNR